MDCSITENYLTERGRMTKKCKDCDNCPISFINNGKKITCGEFEINHPAEAIAIVQKWSDEHSIMTMTNMEKYIQIMNDTFNAGLDNCNLDEWCCPPIGGSICFTNKHCDECIKWWDEPYKEPEEIDK